MTDVAPPPLSTEASTSTAVVDDTAAAASTSSPSTSTPNSVYPLFSTNKLIQDGDLIILQLTRDNLSPITVRAGEETNNRYGNYKHDTLIGTPFGSKVGSSNGKGFCYVLRPTPELWTLALPHRTQILYIADIAYILSELNIRPGSVVIEAGTGSGSFSHSVARAVAPHGFLHSFEFHETRAEKAKVEFQEHGMGGLTKLRHQNVCKAGFELESVADAVFLDLPAPWDAIESAKTALRSDRVTRICCFSPCIEQVLRTVTALSTHGFSDISMSETLFRQHEVNTQISLPPVGTARAHLLAQEERRAERRLVQIREGKEREVVKRKLAEVESPGGSGASSPVHGAGKKGESTSAKEHRGGPRKRGEPIPFQTTLAKPIVDARGHTSYLTFATLVPAHLRPGSADVDDEEEETEEEKLDVPEPTFDTSMDKALADLTEEELAALG